MAIIDTWEWLGPEGPTALPNIETSVNFKANGKTFKAMFTQSTSSPTYAYPEGATPDKVAVYKKEDDTLVEVAVTYLLEDNLYWDWAVNSEEYRILIFQEECTEETIVSVLQTYAINGTLANAIKSYSVSGEILVELGSFIRKFYPNLEVFPLSNLPELLDNLVSAESLKI